MTGSVCSWMGLNYTREIRSLSLTPPYLVDADNASLKDQELNAEFLGSCSSGKMFHEKGWHGGTEKRLIYRQKRGGMDKLITKEETPLGQIFKLIFTLKSHERRMRNKMINSYFFLTKSMIHMVALSLSFLPTFQMIKNFHLILKFWHLDSSKHKIKHFLFS